MPRSRIASGIRLTRERLIVREAMVEVREPASAGEAAIRPVVHSGAHVERARPCLAPLAAALFAFSTFAISIGLGLVDPTETRWLFFGGDPEIHFLAWHLFRNGPWSQPLGAIPNLMWPVGTSLGLTDAIPLFAFLFKPFSALLPADFQYLQLWVLCSAVLQGVFGAVLMRTVTDRVELQLLGACLCVMSPPAINRYNAHAALSAHWMLLAALWLYFRDRTRRPGAAWVILCSLAAATHPYLALMVVILMAAAHARAIVVHPASWKRVVLQVAAAVGCAALVLWQCGYFVAGAANLQATRFGYFSMNLLSPFLPISAYNAETGPFRPITDGQYEGYAYFGAGVLMLSAVALVMLPRTLAASSKTRSDYLRNLPFAVALGAFVLLALSPVVTLGRWTLVEYDQRWWGPLTLFRASGRMFWPVYYAVVLGAIAAAVRLAPRTALVLLSSAVLLQAADVSRTYRELRGLRGGGFVAPLHSRFWDVAPSYYRRIVVFPSRMCTAERTFDFRPFALVAGRHGIAINAGATARPDTPRVEEYCRTLDREIAQGIIDDETLYILRSDLVPAFREKAAGRAICLTVDEHDVCVAKETAAQWAGAVDGP